MTTDRLIAGRYRLEEAVGAGAMGVVWRAQDTRLRREVAVKQLVLAPGLTAAQAVEARMRALREGRIAARLHHPHAVTVFDVADDDGQPWLVMEYVDAMSLAVLLRERGALAPLAAARIGSQVAAALAAAHAAGIVHRDVKPANILVTGSGTAKITDFGISRAVGDITVTSSGFLAGTPAYLAPEIARGENPQQSSDVFALGATLYAAVEGTPPFGEGDNPLALLHTVARGQVPPPQRAGVLEPVLMSLLAENPAQRPDMAGAEAALGAVADIPGPAATATAVSDGGVRGDLPRTRVDLGGLPRTRVDPAAADADPAVRPEPVGSPPASQPSPGAKLPALQGNAPTKVVAYGPRGKVAPRSRSGRPVLLAGVVAAVILVGVFAAVFSEGGGHRAGMAARATASAVATARPPAPASAANAAPAPSTTTVTSTQPPGLSAFITSYYALLPGDTATAWSQLAPVYQDRTGGYGAYVSYWATVASINVTGVTETGPDTAAATLVYTLKNGRVSQETRWFRVDFTSGRMVITESGV